MYMLLTDKVYAFILVLPKVEAQKSEKDQSCILGEDTQISWKFSGIEKPQVTWFLNDQPIPTNDRFQVTEIDDGTSELSIHQAELADQGIYTAMATNSVGKAEAKITLSIIIKPMITVNLDGSLQAIKEETMTLKIVASGTPKPDIVWMKGNNEIKPNDRVHKTTEDHDDNYIYTLVISHVEPEDQGEYSAKIFNIGESLVSNKCKVTVSKPPIFVVKPTALTVKQDEKACLKIQIDGYPTPKIIWLLNGKQLKAEEGVQMQFNPVTNEAMLVIENVDLEQHAGSITCRLENEYGNEEERVKLEILAAPIITARLPQQRETVTGQDVTLKVVAKGSPRPSAQWFFNDQPIVSENLSVNEANNEYQLVIKRATIEKNEGAYRIVLKNDVGEVHSNSCVVTVLEPVKLKQVVPTSNEAQLKCGETFEITVDVSGKEIPEVRLMKDGEAMQFTNVETTRYKFVVANVQLQHQGVYMVIAKNKTSTEEMTVTLNVTAPQEFAAPGTCDELDRAQLHAKWSTDIKSS
ncbi:unnamed protein product [Rotaria socialis]|uniref:Ig-like domain-containing protein n=2 Tax=Rotaria socialis TaxID=392032 RepID=A0A820ZD86_9BILA|nr:unnamed protein product [Rotaria socialis]